MYPYIHVSHTENRHHKVAQTIAAIYEPIILHLHQPPLTTTGLKDLII